MENDHINGVQTPSEPSIIAGEAQTAQCGTCGGHLEFNPATQKMKCPFCGNEKELEFTKDNVIEIDLSDMSHYDFNWNIEKKVVACQNCGGETITDENDETTFCSFCGSQHMLLREATDMGMKPQALVPYTLTQDNAKENLKKWMRKRYLAPRDLKHRYLNKNLKGIYIPFWTFDAQTDTQFRCDIGTYYYTGTGDKKQRQVRWRSHSGAYDTFFDDRLVCGIQHEHRKFIKKVEPFNLNLLVDYEPHFLAGYYAQKYVIIPKDAYGEAQNDMKAAIQNTIVSGLPGDTHRAYQQNVNFSEVTFKHILLPLYMMAYSYKEKMYHVMVNGQTGEVQGQSPLSPVKVAALVLLAILAVILFLVIRNNN